MLTKSIIAGIFLASLGGGVYYAGDDFVYTYLNKKVQVLFPPKQDFPAKPKASKSVRGTAKSKTSPGMKYTFFETLLNPDVDNYLGLSARAGEDVRLGSFQAQMKINWGKDLRPKEAFIRSRNSGEKAIVRFRARKGYKEASDIEFIPKGRNYRIVADFENLKEPGETIPIEGFLQNFSGFEFVVAWDG